MTIRELQEKKASVVRELQAISDRAKAENERRLTAGEQERWDNLMKAVDSINEEIMQREDLVAAAENPGCIDGPQHMRRVDPFGTASPVVERARALIDSKHTAEVITDPQREALERLVVRSDDNVEGEVIAKRLIATERPEYRSAFQRIVTETHPVLTAEEAKALRGVQDMERAMSEGTTTAGGFGVPVLIDPTIILSAQGSQNDFFQISRVEPITTNVWKGVSSAGMSWSFDTEASEVSDDSPTLAQPSVTAYTARGFIPFSIELGQDYPAFAREMGTLLTEGYSELTAEKFSTGTGTNEPKGIVTALDADTTAEVVVTTDGAFGAVDLYKVWDALPNRFRKNASWMSSTDVQNEIRNFGATFGANFTSSIAQKGLTELFGGSYYLNDFMDDFTGTTGAANLLVVGDFKKFLIAQRQGMVVELVPTLFGSNRRPTGQRGLFAWARVGSDVTTTKGFKLLQNQ